MMGGLVALDLLRGDSVNWTIVLIGGAVFFGFKLLSGLATARTVSYRKAAEEENSEEHS